jgi:hypothetical protein
MLPPIFRLLKASVSVAAILGAQPKVYRHGQAPQGTQPPYVTWTVIGGAPENTLSEAPSTDRIVVQVDCYHSTDEGIEQLAAAVRAALEGDAYCTGIPLDQREPETRWFRMALQFDFLLAR